MSYNKDTDYLALSARIHAMETKLLTRERMDRMIDAKDHIEAAKVLTECRYGELNEVTSDTLEALLSQAQSDVFRDLGASVPNPNLIDVFRIKYDYHNAKVLIKSEATGAQPDHLLMGGGRYEPEELADAYRRSDMRNYSETFQQALTHAKESLASTADPQLCDFILDRACYAELSGAAQATGSPFVKGYAALLIDTVNLRSAVRASRLDKNYDFLMQVLLPGGSVDVQIIAQAKGSELDQVFSSGALATAATLGAAVSAPHSGSLTAFERACDDALTHYISTAKRIPFGAQPIVGYLYAREAELTAIRTIMNGRLAGLDGDTIRERLREAYV